MVKRTRDVAAIAGIVYFIQGALGITAVALPLYMRKLHWTVGEISAISSMAALPWVLKIFYGFLSDSYPLFGYRRKSYLVLFSFVSSLGWLAMVLLPPDKQWVMLGLTMANLGFAATDVITDGLIVEHSTAFTSPVYQAIAWGSRSFGAMASGITGGWLASHWEPAHIFLLTMFLPLFGGGAALLIREKKMDSSPFKSALAPIQKCISLLSSKKLGLFALMLVAVGVSASLSVPFFFHMKEILGFQPTFLGVFNTIGWAGGILGSLIYARWLRHVEPKKLLIQIILWSGIGTVALLFIQTEMQALVVVFFLGLLGCLFMLRLFSTAAAMTHHTGVEGTLFAVLMSIFNLGQIGFGYFGGYLSELIGLKALILLTGTIFMSIIFLVKHLDLEPQPLP